MAAPAKDFVQITDSEIAPDSPETTGLMTKLRDALEHLEEWLGKDFVAAINHKHDGVDSALISGANLVLVERKELTANATSVDFTGLDGDTDEVYVLHGKIRSTAGLGTAVLFKPNALATNQVAIETNSDGSSVTTGTLTALRVGRLVGSGSPVFTVFDAIFFAKATIQSLGHQRGLLARSMSTNTPGVLAMFQSQITGFWTDTSANLTAIRIESGTNALGTGTVLTLYKVRQT